MRSCSRSPPSPSVACLARLASTTFSLHSSPTSSVRLILSAQLVAAVGGERRDFGRPLGPSLTPLVLHLPSPFLLTLLHLSLFLVVLPRRRTTSRRLLRTVFNATAVEDLITRPDPLAKTPGTVRIAGVVTNHTLVTLAHGLQSCSASCSELSSSLPCDSQGLG